MRGLFHGSAVLLLALWGGVDVLAQSVDTVPTIQPTFTRIHTEEGSRVTFPSPSPDGRWIAFDRSDGGGHVSLWLVPMEGGEAIQLTQDHWDVHPVWFPSGDRIAFRSDRPSRGENGGSYIMTLSIDPETGHPTGPPRQVSIEECFSYLDVSPDGQWITFTAWSEGKAILVVPAAGGTSRVVARAGPWRPTWGPDGENIYYTVSQPLNGEGEALVRVSADGAKEDTVFTWPRTIMKFGSPERGWALREVSSGAAGPSHWEVVGLDGVPVARLELPLGMDAMSATPGGQELVAVRRDRVAPLEILPIDGGPSRRLNETRGQDEVLGWTPDGESVFFRTTLDGGEAFFFAATSGGLMLQVSFPEQPLNGFSPILSADGQHLLYASRDEESKATSLRVLDLQRGESREMSGSPLLPSSFGEISGRGGTFLRDGDDFLYVERRGDYFELRAAGPDGSSRALHTFRGELPDLIAVHGNRIAYTQRGMRQDPTIDPGTRGPESVMLAQVGEEEAHSLLTLEGHYLESVTWSWDGTRLALSTERMDPGSRSPQGMELLVLSVGSSGEVFGEPTVLDTPENRVFWSPRWLPDDETLLIPTGNAMVWRISTDPGTRPVNVTSDLNLRGSWVSHAVFRLSPDGRFIAYAGEVPQGSSIWRVDLGDTPNGGIH